MKKETDDEEYDEDNNRWVVHMSEGRLRGLYVLFLKRKMRNKYPKIFSSISLAPNLYNIKK